MMDSVTWIVRSAWRLEIRRRHEARLIDDVRRHALKAHDPDLNPVQARSVKELDQQAEGAMKTAMQKPAGGAPATSTAGNRGTLTIRRTLPMRLVALVGLAAAVSLQAQAPADIILQQPEAEAESCEYASPRVRAWQLEQAEQLGAQAAYEAAAPFGPAGPPC